MGRSYYRFFITRFNNSPPEIEIKSTTFKTWDYLRCFDQSSSKIRRTFFSNAASPLFFSTDLQGRYETGSGARAKLSKKPNDDKSERLDSKKESGRYFQFQRLWS